MSRTAQMARITAAAFQRYTFTAWQTMGGQAYPASTGSAETLTEAVNRAALACQHKATLFVLQRDELTGAQVLSISAIKARKAWRKCPDTLVTKQVSESYPAEITQVRVSAFAPWSFDVMADPVGSMDDGCIEQGARVQGIRGGNAATLWKNGAR